MKDTEYACAVATVRSKEAELFNMSYAEQLIDATDFNTAKSILVDKGVTGFAETDDVSKALSDYMPKILDFLKEILPDKNALDFLIVKNDFHNLKASIKGLISNTDPHKMFIKPSILDSEFVYESVKSKNFDNLPKWISQVATDSYQLLTSTMDGQLFDIFVDTASLQAVKDFSANAESEFAMLLADKFVTLTNIKIALRLSAVKSTDAVVENAFCQCDGLDVIALAKSTLKGADDVLTYLDSIGFNDLIVEYAKSSAAFENKCDSIIMGMLDEAKRISFGIEPLIAFYLAKVAEHKTIKVIMSGKHIGLTNAEIKERVRELYV